MKKNYEIIDNTEALVTALEKLRRAQNEFLHYTLVDFVCQISNDLFCNEFFLPCFVYFI